MSDEDKQALHEHAAQAPRAWSKRLGMSAGADTDRRRP